MLHLSQPLILLVTIGHQSMPLDYYFLGLNILLLLERVAFLSLFRSRAAPSDWLEGGLSLVCLAGVATVIASYH